MADASSIQSRAGGGIIRIPPFFFGYRPLVILLAGCLLSGCTLMLQPPTVKCGAVSFAGIGSGGVDLEVVLQVENPNNFDIVVHGYRYDLAVMDIPFSSGSEKREVPLPPRTISQVLMPVRVPLGSIVDLLAKGPDPDRVPYGLEAILDVSTPFITRQVPVKSSGSFAVPARYRPDHYLQQLRSLLPWAGGER